MNQRLIVIGGSAGSLASVFRILAALKVKYPFPLLLVMHRLNNNDSMLEDLLSTRSELVVREIEEKDAIMPGHIYIAPADYHVLVETDESFSLDVSEKVHFSRPSLDVVFRSVADVFGKRVVGIVLSGANSDGAEGLRYIHEKGGVTIVQEPADAQVSYMPEQAIRLAKPDHTLDAEGIAALLNQLAC